jgi:hypothetical protein
MKKPGLHPAVIIALVVLVVGGLIFVNRISDKNTPVHVEPEHGSQ